VSAPLPPGPRGAAALPVLAALARDSQGPMVDLVRRFGDVAGLRNRGRHFIVVGGHEQAREILVTRQDEFGKGIEYELLRLALGDGLLTSEGELWRRQRTLVQPMFAKRHLGAFTGHMTRATVDAIAALEAEVPDGATVDVAGRMMALTLDVVGRALFGADLAGDTSRRVGRAMDDVLGLSTKMARRPRTFAASLLPGMDLRRAMWANPEARRFFRALDELDRVIGGLLDARTAAAEPGQDLLGLLLGARDEATGEPMSRRQVRDELMTFMGAGHETTANALAWTWRQLARHPEARERLQAEVDDVLGDRVPAMDDVDRLPWTRACVEETMRLFPPVWTVGRRALDDLELGGFSIPRDSSVFVLIRMVHRDPAVWADPEGFDPRRFLPEAARGRPRSAFLPFGAGRRICVGSSFATIEAVLLAAMLARRFTFELPRAERLEEEATITLRPRGGLPMVVRRRATAR
jgi:cytochrome P450